METETLFLLLNKRCSANLIHGTVIFLNVCQTVNAVNCSQLRCSRLCDRSLWLHCNCSEGNTIDKRTLCWITALCKNTTCVFFSIFPHVQPVFSA